MCEGERRGRKEEEREGGSLDFNLLTQISHFSGQHITVLKNIMYVYLVPRQFFLFHMTWVRG